MLISPLTVVPQILRLDIPVMIAVSGLLLLLAIDRTIGQLDGAVLIAGLLL
jgi:cation:H+ antiporter